LAYSKRQAVSLRTVEGVKLGQAGLVTSWLTVVWAG